MYYTAKTPLVKCIETSTGCHSHTPRASSVKKYWEYVHIVKSNLEIELATSPIFRFVGQFESTLTKDAKTKFG